jgi:hypothetical protein
MLPAALTLLHGGRRAFVDSPTNVTPTNVSSHVDSPAQTYWFGRLLALNTSIAEVRKSLHRLTSESNLVT